jgi:hypothetical protein
VTMPWSIVQSSAAQPDVSSGPAGGNRPPSTQARQPRPAG